MTELEHANVTVMDNRATARMLCDVFGWHVRWEGDARDGGHSIHVGSAASYIAVFTPGPDETAEPGNGRLNHLAVVVDDLDATEARVKEAGYRTTAHGDYEPGRRFYFREENGMEIEVVSYP